MKTEVKKESGLKFLKKISEAGRIALFYGFLPLESPKITKEELALVRDLEPEWRPAEKAAILREFSELKSQHLSQPLMFFYEKVKQNRIECELVVLGSHRSISEAILIQVGIAILENAGLKETFIRINSVGNKDNIAEFERKMATFLRRRIADFPPELRQNLKKDIFYLTKSKSEKYKEWAISAPQSVDYLSEESRLHLKDLLEFLEISNFSYIMDSSLLGDTKYCTETVFEIVKEVDSSKDSKEEILARGLRWSRLSKKLDLKREVGVVSLNINTKTGKFQKMTSLKAVKPKFHLVQFGPEAKQKCFLVLENLRKSGIAVTHSLGKDKLTGQISFVEQTGVPYIILLGQKEAIDNVVVIRRTATRAQYVVPIAEIGEFIKNSNEFKN